MDLKKQVGITMIEMFIVLIIAAAATGMALPFMRQRNENKQAKAALETLRSISQAARLFEIDRGRLPGGVTVDAITELNNDGYIDRAQFAPYYDYAFIFSGLPIPEVRACSPSCAPVGQRRLIRMSIYGSQGKAHDGGVTDSAGFLNPTS